MPFCKVCGNIDNHYDGYGDAVHEATPKHQFNMILYTYKIERKKFTNNKNINISVTKTVHKPDNSEIVFSEVEQDIKKVSKLRILAKPKDQIKFDFKVKNNYDEDLLVVGVALGHPQPQFTMNEHGLDFGRDPYILPSKSFIPRKICVIFSASDIGSFDMPVFFIFSKKNSTKALISICDLVITLQENPHVYVKTESPYKDEFWEKVDKFIKCKRGERQDKFKIPSSLKLILPKGIEDNALDKLNVSQEEKVRLQQLLVDTRTIIEEGVTENNYIFFFHHLLWWEEAIQKINLKKYNMSKVHIMNEDNSYMLRVPGLAEKRPSLLRGDRVYLRPCENESFIIECVIKDIRDNTISLGEMDAQSMKRFYRPEAEFSARFIMSRMPLEKMHEAVSILFTSHQTSKVFPVPVSSPVRVETIKSFYNPDVQTNEEQKMAVQCIVSGTSGTAPYLVYGPPGTGKTVTIVEAIIQLVMKDANNRILVCTDSNMAADHVACMLLRCNEKLNIDKLLLRANSRNRVWEVMPSYLYPVSNGKSYETSFSVNNVALSQYRVVVATLIHSAKYASDRSQKECKLSFTHLFIDEAAQSLEPACLVPITGLLSPEGQLILSGDPQQLGPVCISKAAKSRGLGVSLMERLMNTYENLYGNYTMVHQYITMLRNNFRSNPDILDIPNELFYDNALRYLAPEDPLSKVNILGETGGNRAIVFHSVSSKEEKEGKSPSFFNTIELEMLQRYIKRLIQDLNVLPEDIGVISPYMRQAFKVRSWLKKESYDTVDVGTVEAFQGKEKRVILVTTVRANCGLLDYDAKYGLGFLVDDKRFNVTLTRAKAKIIIIGNPLCLVKDCKWRKYMDKCKSYDAYFGQDNEQLPRTPELLHLVVEGNFKRFGIYSLSTPKDESENERVEN